MRLGNAAVDVGVEYKYKSVHVKGNEIKEEIVLGNLPRNPNAMKPRVTVRISNNANDNFVSVIIFL